MRKPKKYYVVCLSNSGYKAALEPRKIYAALSDADAEREGLLRIIDESGEDYLFPKASFVRIKLTRQVEQALAAG